MKKFWNMVLVAMVAMGAAACTNDQVESVGPTEEGVSFYAEFVNNDGTRAYIDDTDGDKTWNTIWEQGDILQVSADAVKFYIFEYDSEKGKFTCNTEGVTSLVGQTVDISAYLGGNLNSKAGKKAWNCQGTKVDNFATSDEPVQLTANTSFLRYTYDGDGDVTFSIKGTNDRKVFVYDDYVYHDEVTISGVKGENFVAFWIQDFSLEATLSYSIGGVECKTANLNLTPGKIYNLGTLEKIDRVYLAPGEWDKENAWFAAYFYKNAVESVASASATRAAVDANKVWVKMTDNDGDGTYECIVPEGFPHVVFCRMNSADTETMSFDNAWNQTVDIAIDTTAEDFHENNSYFITSWGNDEDGENKKSEGAWGKVPNAVVTPDQTSTWSLAGEFNEWGDTDMVTTSTANLYVLKNVALDAYEEFKIKKNHSWDENYGGGHYYINANHYAQLYFEGHNVSVTEGGNYDIYFHSVYKLLYIVTAGTDYDTATWQENEGKAPTAPSTPGEASPWSLSGTFNEWGDAEMVTTSISSVFVVEDVTLEAYASFKVRKDKLWDENYGGGIVYMNPNGYIKVYSGGGDVSNTAAGTYDVYFDYANKLLYLVDAGTDYTTVAEQTVEGEEPEVEEPEVTENVLYLVPNANWKVDNARFAAYFFNNSGNAWVSMVDSDSDGIYEVNIPTGYTFGDNVIFCRMNPGTTANNWNNKWNQTADLTIPTDGKNLYTVKEGTWDSGGGAWSTK